MTTRPSLSLAFGFAAAVVAGFLVMSLGCHHSAERAWVVVRVERGDADVPVHRIELLLALDGRMETRTLSEPDDAEIALPTDASIEIVRSRGALVVSAIARDAAGLEVARGAAEVVVESGRRDVTVTLARPPKRAVCLGASGISRTTSEGTILELAIPVSVVLGRACCP